MSLSMKWSAITASTFVVAMVLLTSRFLGQIPVALTNCLVIVGALVLTFLELRGETTDSTMRRYVFGLAIFILFSMLYLIVAPNIYVIRIFLISIFCFSQVKAVQGNEKSLATL
ncbi:MAG: hypothetical protein M1469_05245 [Bacteroidetes bacterium]|nr:hypothetical protein [Bacteroidota bacterium]